MKIPEAYSVLGVEISASREEIKAAYRRRAKETHPDFHGPGERSHEAFRQVQEARDVLCGARASTAVTNLPLPPIGKAPGISSTATAVTSSDALEDGMGVSQEAEPELELHVLAPPEAVVRQHLSKRGISIWFDGSFHVDGAPRMAMHRGDLEAYLAVEELTFAAVVDDVLLELKASAVKMGKGDVELGLRKVVRKERRKRFMRVVRRLCAATDGRELEEAKKEWSRLATLFNLEPTLVIAILKHYVWQVKQKITGRPVVHHLMPIVWSALQGSGKTNFAIRFLSPLEDLASDPVLLSDFADSRSRQVYGFPAVLIDDVGEIDRRSVPNLKSILTNELIQRRKMNTDRTEGTRQLATPFGTANCEVGELVVDNTGHRRFAMLPFRNGDVAKGGNPEVWETVNSTNYDLLWRSVDAWGPSPIKPFLSALAAHQQSAAPDVFGTWILALDLESEAVRHIETRHGVGTKALWELFCAQAESTMSMKAFAQRMDAYAGDPASRFGAKHRTMEGFHYRIKRDVNTPGKQTEAPSSWAM